MIKLFQSHHPIRHAKSFKHAFEGLFHALINEPNFRVQVVIVALAVYFGKRFNITNIEWSILIISLGLLLAAEIANTVVEELMDHFVKEEDPIVKIIKDLSAGFVLIAAISTLIILYLTFSSRL
jgi:diacylglycerol kinase